jgi:hypothetical protein
MSDTKNNKGSQGSLIAVVGGSLATASLITTVWLVVGMLVVGS